jgi:rhodanese-related sulfurtransferase
MIFEQIRHGGCLSYLIGCEVTNSELPDPTARIVTYCQLGKISTLAAHTLRTMGYLRTVALDGGFDAWVKASGAVELRSPLPSAGQV